MDECNSKELASGREIVFWSLAGWGLIILIAGINEIASTHAGPLLTLFSVLTIFFSVWGTIAVSYGMKYSALRTAIYSVLMPIAILNCAILIFLYVTAKKALATQN